MAIRHVLSLGTCLLLFSVYTAHALPHDSVNPALPLLKRGAVIAYDESGKIINITDSSTSQLIDQGSASDGGGTGFDACAIIWLAWSLTIGVWLTLAGFSLWRPTTGSAIGIAGVVCVWSAFVNTINANGVSDLLLTLIVMGAFVFGFAIGIFEVGRIAGITLMGILGGLSVGVRIVLFRSNLLIPYFSINWVIITMFGLLGLLMIMLSHRIAVMTSAVSIGTFLVGLGVDLAVNQQSGMSRGLRYLFDRNTAHLEDIIGKGYHPPVVTIVILALSLAAIPAFTFSQNLVFKQPFRRRRAYSLASRGSIDSTAAADVDTASTVAEEKDKIAVDITVGSAVTLHEPGVPTSPKVSTPEPSEKLEKQ